MNEYERLISKLNDHIIKLTIVMDILQKAPKLNVDAKIIIKEITHIDIEDLKKQLKLNR